ncbi:MULTISPECIES: hypothetical protein [Bradyrhizobium]|uniref:Uncharacterized protein n=2 Tax=Bradyrhizobium TaxID=374 RepID=A0ABY0Q4C1_9BRAD|nr:MULTISPECIES: hypothetical protein [Bradyrhizobium]SDJ50510.1 hypothetical protein SAMN05444163_5598 [Bradyrhizobium ottawaense]SEC49958.1 hypothetical protein SAMN05444171_1561 [Bradyrhizobium lablabi]SHK70123.1 hypothetical protein SAMN05444321_0391 [Bradyrhizobium lablabi]
MRRSNWAPWIVPNGDDQTVYLIAVDFGNIGRVWRESDYETTDFETVIQDVPTGHYSNLIRIDVAHEPCRCCDLLQVLTNHFEERYRDLQLPLPITLV